MTENTWWLYNRNRVYDYGFINHIIFLNIFLVTTNLTSFHSEVRGARTNISSDCASIMINNNSPMHWLLLIQII
jgi:hypothetical protein